MKLTINPEFQSLIPPLTDEEYSGLEQSVIEDGCRDAIVIWQDTIIDGHNRYSICQKHKIEFKTTKKNFTNNNHVKIWILENQASRRNLTQSQKSILALRLESELSVEAEERILLGKKNENPTVKLQQGQDIYVNDSKTHTIKVDKEDDYYERIFKFQILQCGSKDPAVYFLQPENGGDIKIGCSNDVANRLKQLQISHSERLIVRNIIPGGYEKEKELHNEFQNIKKEGEWFRATRKLSEISKAIPYRMPTSADMAGERIGVSGSYVAQTKKIIKERPEMYDKILSGELDLQSAKNQIKQEKLAENKNEYDKRMAKLTSSLSEEKEKTKNIDIFNTDHKFRVVYADPPWKYDLEQTSPNLGGAIKHYNSMTIEELCGLPVDNITEKNAVLFLWVTSPKLNQCWDIIKSWGFEYKTSFVWDKVKHNMGHYNSVRHEFLLICGKGKSAPDIQKLYDSVQSIERSNTHSEKPVEFMNIIDELYVYGDRIELFARSNKKDNWFVWGNEAV